MYLCHCGILTYSKVLEGHYVTALRNMHTVDWKVLTGDALVGQVKTLPRRWISFCISLVNWMLLCMPFRWSKNLYGPCGQMT